MTNDNSKRTPCLCYTRVCGWLVNKSAFNPGKKAEDADRVTFKQPNL